MAFWGFALSSAQYLAHGSVAAVPDDGPMFSPQISRRRDRITLNGTEFWLARVPNRPRKT